MKTKLLTKCLLGGTLIATSIANAGFFEFQEGSKLSALQKNMLKVLFVDKSVQGISSMVSTFQATVLKDIVVEYKVVPAPELGICKLWVTSKIVGQSFWLIIGNERISTTKQP